MGKRRLSQQFQRSPTPEPASGYVFEDEEIPTLVRSKDGNDFILVLRKDGDRVRDRTLSEWDDYPCSSSKRAKKSLPTPKKPTVAEDTPQTQEIPVFVFESDIAVVTDFEVPAREDNTPQVTEEIQEIQTTVENGNCKEVVPEKSMALLDSPIEQPKAATVFEITESKSGMMMAIEPSELDRMITSAKKNLEEHKVPTTTEIPESVRIYKELERKRRERELKKKLKLAIEEGHSETTTKMATSIESTAIKEANLTLIEKITEAVSCGTKSEFIEKAADSKSNGDRIPDEATKMVKPTTDEVQPKKEKKVRLGDISEEAKNLHDSKRRQSEPTLGIMSKDSSDDVVFKRPMNPAPREKHSPPVVTKEKPKNVNGNIKNSNDYKVKKKRSMSLDEVQKNLFKQVTETSRNSSLATPGDEKKSTTSPLKKTKDLLPSWITNSCNQSPEGSTEAVSTAGKYRHSKTNGLKSKEEPNKTSKIKDPSRTKDKKHTLNQNVSKEPNRSGESSHFSKSNNLEKSAKSTDSNKSKKQIQPAVPVVDAFTLALFGGNPPPQVITKPIKTSSISTKNKNVTS